MTREEREHWDKYVLFLHKLTGRYAARCRSLRLNLEYDDLFQEASLAYMYAKKGFNPDRGLKFITYLGAAVARNLHTYVSQRIKKAQRGPSFTYIDDLGLTETDNLMSASADVGSPQESSLEVQEEAERVLGMLSPLALLTFRLVNAPPEELKAEYQAWRFKRGAMQQTVEQDRSVSTNFVCRYFIPKLCGITPSKARKIEWEIKNVIGSAEL